LKTKKQEIGKGLEKFQMTVVKTSQEFISQLKKFTPDIVITAYKLPSLDGLTVLRHTRGKSQHIPVIILTASLNEAAAVACMKAGAADYVTKENISRLGKAVIDEIKNSEAEEKKIKNTDSLVSSAEVYHRIFAYNSQPMFIYDIETLAILEVNNAALEQYGYTREEFLSLTLREINPVDDLQAVMNTTEKQPHFRSSGNWRHLKKSGEIMHVEITSHPISYNGRKACFMQVTDYTKRKKAGEALKSSEEKYRTLFENVQDIFFQTDLEGILYEISPSVDRYLGFSRWTILRIRMARCILMSFSSGLGSGERSLRG